MPGGFSFRVVSLSPHSANMSRPHMGNERQISVSYMVLLAGLRFGRGEITR